MSIYFFVAVSIFVMLMYKLFTLIICHKLERHFKNKKDVKSYIKVKEIDKSLLLIFKPLYTMCALVVILTQSNIDSSIAIPSIPVLLKVILILLQVVLSMFVIYNIHLNLNPLSIKGYSSETAHINSIS